MSRITDARANEKLVQARTRLLFSNFFFGRIAMYLQLVEEPACKTLAVDGRHIFYNPQFTRTLNDELSKSAMAHEIGHCILQHFLRRGARDPDLWNQAGDYAINLMLRDAGFQIGANWLLSDDFIGMSAERIYDILLKEKQQGKSRPGQALCEIRNAPADSTRTPAQQSMEWGGIVAAAAMEARNQGRLPASMERFIDGIIHPRVPWRIVLQDFLTQLARDDYSWTRPNRRFIHSGLYLPALYSVKVGPIAVVIDSSGSIYGAVLKAFLSEIQAIADLLRPERITVLSADAKVQNVQVFEAGEPLDVKVKGGGGTDFRPAIDHFKDEPPLALVYLTDMEGRFGEEPEFPVLWCATTDIVAPWGRTVKLALDD